MPALLALASACTFGVADFLGGLSTRRAAVVAVTLVSNLAGGLLALVLVFLIDGAWSTGAIAWGAIGGVAGLTGLVLLYQGLAEGPNRLVSPLAAVVAAVVPITAGVGLGERPGPLASLGLVLAPVAIWMVAGGDLRGPGSSRRPMAMAVGAGLSFGVFFTFLAQTPADAGAVPLLAARTASLTLILLAALLLRPARPAVSVTGIAFLAGTLDMTANGLFLWSTLDGDLAIVGALVSLFPATTVMLAVAFLGERLDRNQVVGLVLAIVTAGLLS